MGTQPNALDLARQGHPKAISTLLNRALQPHGINVQVRRKGDCLHMVLDAAQVPKQQTMVRYISSNLAKLEMTSVCTVKIYGRQLGQDFPAWSNAVVLPPQNGSKSTTPSLESDAAPPKTQLTAEATKPSKPIQADQTLTGGAAIAQSPDPIAARSQESTVNPPSVQSGKSPDRLGRTLITALMVQISFDGLVALLSFSRFVAYSAFDRLNSSEVAGNSIKLVILSLGWIENSWDPVRFVDIGFLWITMALFLIWFYRLQKTLKAVFPRYPITPWGAVARFALPFYNVWGIWTILAAIAHHLKSWRQTARWGIALWRWLPWYYAAWSVIWILQRIDWMMGRPGLALFLPLAFQPVLYSLSLVLSMLMLKLVWIMHRATVPLAIQNPK